jgi:hypothetical protein
MRNAQKPSTPRTRHMGIKYFSFCEWVERDLMHLKQIYTSFNMADHFTKAINYFLLGHVPLMYLPIYHTIVGTCTDHAVAFECFVPVPDSFTTPICAAAARAHALHPEDYAGNPWLIVIFWHG